MKKINISLSSIANVKEFVEIVTMSDYEIDLVSGRYTVDAKSIMGIFALDTLSPIEVIAHTDDASEFFKIIDRFVVKNWSTARWIEREKIGYCPIFSLFLFDKFWLMGYFYLLYSTIYYKIISVENLRKIYM